MGWERQRDPEAAARVQVGDNEVLNCDSRHGAEGRRGKSTWATRKCEERRLSLRVPAWAPSYETGKERRSVNATEEYVLGGSEHIRKFGLTVLPFREASAEEAWLLCTNPRACLLGRENDVGKGTGTGHGLVGLVGLQLAVA